MRSPAGPPASTQRTGYVGACAALETALSGSMRRETVESAGAAADFGSALARLREGMRANAWTVGGRGIRLEPFVNRFDQQTRREGFHALHDWDGKAGRVNADTIPVDVLNYVAAHRGADPPDRESLAMVLDYYFLHLLALLSLRVWDDGDPDGNLARLERLLALLQGEQGSGQPFAADAETLILIATCHYEPNEDGYELLLRRVRTLARASQVKVALGHAASMGSHLRFGFEATYVRDTAKMRDDNVADYPWLCYAVTVLMREYDRMAAEAVSGPARDLVVEALFNGLSTDVGAFFDDPAPSCLRGCEPDRGEFRALFARHRARLLAEFEALRPGDDAYSPLSFFFNFSHNVLKGTIVDALVWGEPWTITFNDLLTSLPRGDERNAIKHRLATTLMGYARANPDRIRGRLMPVIVYDPQAGRQAFAFAMRRLHATAA